MSDPHHFAKPYFSIVIPLYNREKEIVRAVQSCLNQSFRDFEIVIVDDASSDQSIQAVQQFTDSRIVLLKHSVNSGVCPARNSGIQHSRAEWIIFLDSDHELLPHALEVIFKKSQEVADDIGRLGFMYQWDNGLFSPDPPFQNEVQDYIDFVKWTDKVTGGSDVLLCTRKKTFEKVKFPEDRSYEIFYHYQFAKNFKTQVYPIILGIEYTRASNRISTPSPEGLIRNAIDRAKSKDLLFQYHGKTLAVYAPRQYQLLYRSRVLFHFLSGNRLRGLRYGFFYLSRYPLHLKMWAIITLGLLGPNLLARIKSKAR